MKKKNNNFSGGDQAPNESPQANGADVGAALTPDSAGKEAKQGKTILINKKKPWSLKKKIIVTVASVLAVVILGVGVFILNTLSSGMSGFDTVDKQVSRTPTPADTQQSQQTEETTVPEATPTLDPLGELLAVSDTSILENTVNILLIGVDYAPERSTWKGKKYYHSDVMIIVAVNTLTNEVNLISLPRDTYAKIPGVKGIYKLNASMDCGGSWIDDPKAGCEKVCEAASWMIGGIPVNYYYAVDMTAVKGLVDAIGGLEFDIDLAFKMQGRKYKAGMQHMDGQAVLDYLRVRKDSSITSSSKGETGDLNRINRQKNMLVAIFQKLKDSGILFRVPDIINAFEGNLHTNVDFAKTAALAAYSYNVDSSSIKMHSMDGSSAGGIFNWNFVLTSESKRASIIKKVYGFDISKKEGRQALEQLYGIQVPSYSDYTASGAYELWQKMQIEVTTNAARKYLDMAKKKLDADAELQPKPTLGPAPTADEDGVVPTQTPVPSGNYRRYLEGGAEWAIYDRAEKAFKEIDHWDTKHASRATNNKFNEVIKSLHSDVQDLYKRLELGKTISAADWKNKIWHVDYGDHPYKTTVNQSYVHNQIPVDFN